MSADDGRECTCHPSDNPPVPCPRKYAYTECLKAALDSARLALSGAEADRDMLREENGRMRASLENAISGRNDYCAQYKRVSKELYDAREEIAKLKADCTEACDLAMKAAAELQDREAEIARLHAPPGASVEQIGRQLAVWPCDPLPDIPKAEWYPSMRRSLYERAALIARALSPQLMSGWRDIANVPDLTEVWVGGAYKPQAGAPRAWIARSERMPSGWHPSLPGEPSHWYPAKPPPFPAPE